MNHVSSIFSELSKSLILITALTYLNSLLVRNISKAPGILASIIHGLLFGALAIIGMQSPMVLTEGIIIDYRTVIVMLAGPLAGIPAGITAGILVSGFRAYLGEVGHSPASAQF